MLVNPLQDYQNAINTNPVEAVLETIEKAPVDNREQLYIQLANREAANGDPARARQIVNDHVANPFQRRQAARNIEQQEMYRSLGKGNVEEALRVLWNRRNPKERAAQLIQIISQIGQGRESGNGAAPARTGQSAAEPFAAGAGCGAYGRAV